MSVAGVLGLAAAGVGAGLAGSMAGLASLVSFPALLAAGLAPVVANVTNTVALVGSGVGSALGSRPELAGQGPRLRALLPAAVVGGLLGAALLLLGPASAFEAVVPWFVGASALLLLAQERIAALREGMARRRAARLAVDGDPVGGGAAVPVGRRPRGRLALAVGAVSVYGGYFGAGAGVVVFALLAAATPTESPQRANAAKNVLLGSANLVAAVVFALTGPVVWGAALPLAAGFVAGARLGPVLVRRVPRRAFRWAVGIAGLGLAVQLGISGG